MYKNTLPSVTAWSRWGKIQVVVLRRLLYLLHLIKGRVWQTPPPNVHDDPRHFELKDILYFAYKYYFSAPTQSDAIQWTEKWLQKHPPIFLKNNHFVAEQSLTLTAAGDLMPYEWIQDKFCPQLWDDIADDFFAADVVFANLETPILPTTPAAYVPEVMLNDMLFNANEAMFDLFAAKKWGGRFDILSTANNHSLDMGEAGVASTIDFLQQRHIAHCGTARTAAEREKTTIIERNGIRLAFLAYTYSLNQFTNPVDKPFLVNHLEINQANISFEQLQSLRDDVQRAKTDAKADLVILSLHFSCAYQAFPPQHIVENVEKLFAYCGVDVILGGHAHNLQPMANVPFVCPFSGAAKMGFVIFALSDFIAYDIFNWCHLSVYLKLKIEKGKLNGIAHTRLANVLVTPVFAAAEYKNSETRDLRLLNMYRALENITEFSPQNQKMLIGLRKFYQACFQINHP
jgi:Bacterial capsule synthesis protein PGA_cap